MARSDLASARAAYLRQLHGQLRGAAATYSDDPRIPRSVVLDLSKAIDHLDRAIAPLDNDA